MIFGTRKRETLGSEHVFVAVHEEWERLKAGLAGTPASLPANLAKAAELNPVVVKTDGNWRTVSKLDHS